MYSGYLSVTYGDYIDLGTGKSLQVVPGGVYDIQATGFGAPDIPPGDFTLVTDDDEKEDEEKEDTEPSPAPEVEE